MCPQTLLKNIASETLSISNVREHDQRGCMRLTVDSHVNKGIDKFVQLAMTVRTVTIFVNNHFQLFRTQSYETLFSFVFQFWMLNLSVLEK